MMAFDKEGSNTPLLQARGNRVSREERKAAPGDIPHKAPETN